MVSVAVWRHCSQGLRARAGYAEDARNLDDRIPLRGGTQYDRLACAGRRSRCAGTRPLLVASSTPATAASEGRHHARFRSCLSPPAPTRSQPGLVAESQPARWQYHRRQSLLHSAPRARSGSNWYVNWCPKATKIALLVNPNNPNAVGRAQEPKSVRRRLWVSMSSSFFRPAPSKSFGEAFATTQQNWVACTRYWSVTAFFHKQGRARSARCAAFVLVADDIRIP